MELHSFKGLEIKPEVHAMSLRYPSLLALRAAALSAIFVFLWLQPRRFIVHVSTSGVVMIFVKIINVSQVSLLALRTNESGS